MDLRSNAARAKLAIILIWIALATEIAMLVSDYFQYLLIENIGLGKAITTEMAESNDLRQRIVAIVYIAVQLTSAIIFIRWFRRAFYNLQSNVDHVEHSDSQAASSWFIPFVNFYRPFSIMKELYLQTELLLAKQLPDYTPSLKFYTLNFWWTFWVLNNIAGQISSRVSLAAKTADEILDSTKVSMAGALIGIPLALITILVIQDYVEKETLLYNLASDNKEDAENVSYTELSLQGEEQ